MAILIDGYNLLHAAGLGRERYGPGGLEKARHALLGVLAASLKEQAQQTTVVFDAAEAPPGVPRELDYRGLRVLFASDHSDADTLLVELIQADSAPKRLTVVSSDHQVQRAARRRRATVVDSEAFLADLARRRVSARKRTPAGATEPRKKFDGNLPESDVAFWLREFDLGQDEDELTDYGFSDATPLKRAKAGTKEKQQVPPGRRRRD